MLPRGGRVYHYPPGRNMPDGPVAGVPGGMLPIPYDMGGMPFRDAAFSQPMTTGALATALANAPLDQQRTVSLSFSGVDTHTEGTLFVYIFYRVVMILFKQDSTRSTKHFQIATMLW